MPRYIVQSNDTPSGIANKLGAPGHESALIATNVQKPKAIIDGRATFKNLYVGEILAIPPYWSRGVRGLGAFGLGDVNSDAAAVAALDPATLCQSGNATVVAFQTSWNAANPTATQLTVDGKYGSASQAALAATLGTSGTAPSACTAYSSGSYTQADLVNAANAVINIASQLCVSSNTTVSTFQTIYNAVTGSTLTIDGEYGPATYAAMQGVGTTAGVTLAGSIPVQCPNFTPASGGGTSTSSGGGTTTTTTTTSTTSTTSNTPLLVGLLVAGGAVGAFMYLKKNPHSTAARHLSGQHHHLAAHYARRR